MSFLRQRNQAASNLKAGFLGVGLWDTICQDLTPCPLDPLSSAFGTRLWLQPSSTLFSPVLFLKSENAYRCWNDGLSLNLVILVSVISARAVIAAVLMRAVIQFPALKLTLRCCHAADIASGRNVLALLVVANETAVSGARFLVLYERWISAVLTILMWSNRPGHSS